MSKRVLFVHGAGEGAYEEDEPLAASLRYHLGADYEVHLLRMPTSYEATFAEWVAPSSLPSSVLPNPFTSSDTR